jgi:flagellar basal body-associated protein FliL
MLEGGDRTGLHGKAEKRTNWVLIVIVMLVLAGGAAAAVVLLMT